MNLSLHIFDPVPTSMRSHFIFRHLLPAAILLASFGCGTGDGPPVIAVTGGAAYLDAARMAMEDAETPSSMYDTLMVVESSNRAAPALEVAERIVGTPNVMAVVGHANSASSLVTAQIYNAAEVVQVAPTTTAVAYSEAGPFSFRMVPSDSLQGPFLAKVLRSEFPEGARVALFYVNDDYGRGLRTAVRSALGPDRFPVVVDLPHLEGGVTGEDVERGVASIAAEVPDVVLWLARPEALRLFLPEIRAHLPRVPIFGGDAVARSLTLGLPEDFWAGVAYTDFVDPEADPRARDFVDRYESRFDREASGGEILVYDAVSVLMRGIEAGARTGPEMRDYLRSLGDDRPAFDGLSGSISFDESGDVDHGSFVLRWLGEVP